MSDHWILLGAGVVGLAVCVWFWWILRRQGDTGGYD